MESIFQTDSGRTSGCLFSLEVNPKKTYRYNTATKHYYPVKRQPIVQKNIGSIEKIARIVIGIALVIWAIAGGPLWAWAGAMLLATGLLSWCPARMLFGGRSCSVEK